MLEMGDSSQTVVIPACMSTATTQITLVRNYIIKIVDLLLLIPKGLFSMLTITSLILQSKTLEFESCLHAYVMTE